MKNFAALFVACLASGALAASAISQNGAARSRLHAVGGTLSALDDAQNGMMDSKPNIRRAEMRKKKKKKKKMKKKKMDKEDNGDKEDKKDTESA
ncbi:hypothetical protein HIM_08540 [Hirsutella minnesotensis 3608]|uniref:Uncharacterized protein n=1 Tax=Hirsutella minnesotensis 3608 TaxID=1043627 RepID=A0A0F7ZMI4_9HYPO|nr:hypothetical protein HIM_08540 [Hirsutella minnesotensis 3608]